MFTSYPIKLVNGHIIIDDGQHLLLDTGSPLSFHSSGLINIGGEKFLVKTSLPFVNSDYLSQKVGERTEGILGMDIINHHPLLVNVKEGHVIFDDDAKYASRFLKAKEMIGGMLAIKLMVNNRMANMVVDTGAHLSYIHHSFIEDTESLGVKEDFSPFTGDFKTNMYMCEVAIQIDDITYKQPMGTLPEKMESSLLDIGVDGVLGVDMFKQFRLQINNGDLFLPPQGI